MIERSTQGSHSFFQRAGSQRRLHVRVCTGARPQESKQRLHLSEVFPGSSPTGTKIITMITYLPPSGSIMMLNHLLTSRKCLKIIPHMSIYLALQETLQIFTIHRYSLLFLSFSSLFPCYPACYILLSIL